MKTNLSFVLFFLSYFYSLSQSINLPKIDAFYEEAYQKQQFNGTVLIAKNGEILFEKNYGLANIEKNISFHLSTTFQIASITKQFTSISILYLEQENKLKLSDAVQKYLPSFPYPNIQIKHLLTHTSGLADFWEVISMDLDKTKENGNLELLQLLASKNYALAFEVNEQCIYADINSNLLALIIEKVSKQKYDDFLQNTFFKPLNMKDTKAEMNLNTKKITNANLAQGYVVEGSKIVLANSLPANDYMSWIGGFYGDGDITSSARDLLKWMEFLNSNTLIKKETSLKFHEFIQLNNKTFVTDWGWNSTVAGLITDGNTYKINSKIVYNAGGVPGFLSKTINCPETGLSIVILSNLEHPWFWNENILNHIR